MKGIIDKNDLAYITERYGVPLASEPCPIGDKGKVNPHVSRFKYGKDRYLSVFHVKPVYYETNTGAWHPLYEVCQYYGNKNVVIHYEKLLQIHPRYLEWLKKRTAILGGKVLVTNPFTDTPSEYGYITQLVHTTIARPNIGLTTTTVYPDPDPETTTCDGFVTSGYKSTMQLMHDTTTGDGGQATSPFGNNTYIIRTLRNASGYYGARCFWLFDTASIPDGDTINSAILSLYGHTYAYDNDNATTFEIVASNPASNTNIVAGDFDNISYTSFGALAFGSMSQSAYNDFTLDSNGRANVSKTGISKFGALTGQDLNVAAQSSGQDNIFATKESESSGTTTDPKLVVDHSGGSAYTQDIEEAATGNDSIRRDTTKTHEEAGTANDNIIKGKASRYVENVTGSDSVDTLLIKLQTLLESVNITETFTRAMTKAYTEAVGVADTIRKETTKLFSEIVEATASATALTATYVQTLLETVTASDSITRLVGYVRSFIETVTTNDYFRIALNGINALWSDLYSDTADAWSELYTDTTDAWSDKYIDN